MDKQSIPDDYVRMQKCIHCGKDTGAILLNQQLESIPEKQGFIKKSALKKLLKPELYKDTVKSKIIGFEKCPVCLGMTKL